MLHIRTDANPHIATGHIMRCIAIANEFRKHSEDITFVIADKQPCEFLERNKFKYICLNTKWDDLDNEIDQLIKCIKVHNITKLLIDTYCVTENYLSQLSKHTKTIYIDDLFSFVYPVHMLINYNNYYKTMHYEDYYKNKSTKLVLGCNYAPLRDEFMSISHTFRHNISKVLVTAGGTDNYNIIGKILNFLLNMSPEVRNLEYHVIVGKFNSNKIQLELMANNNNNIKLHYDVIKMSEVMLQCDLAITAGGSTMYELCACATPMITFSFADNQIAGVKGFESLGIAKYCGDIRNNKQDVLGNIHKELLAYQKDNQYRLQIVKKMQLLIDGKGAIRLYKEIVSL